MAFKDPMFFIIAGAITAAGMPFAVAFPPTVPAKIAAVAVLILIAAGIAAAVRRLKK